MPMRTYFTLLLVFTLTYCYLPISAQDLGKSAWEKRIRTTENAALRAALLNDYADFLIEREEITEGLQRAQEGFNIAFEEGLPKEMARSFKLIAQGYRSQKQFVPTLRYYLQSIKILEKNNLTIYLAENYQEVAMLYKEQDIPAKTLEYYSKAKEAQIKAGQQVNINILKGIAQASQDIQNYPQAIAYYHQVLQRPEVQNQDTEKLLIYQSLTDVYKATSNYDSAIYYSKQIYEINKKIGDTQATAVALNNLGFLHKYLEDYELSLLYFKQSLDIDGSTAKGITTLSNIGVIHQIKGDYTQSLQAFGQALKIASDKKSPEDIAQAHNYLAAVYLIKGDLSKSKSHAEKAIKVSRENTYPEGLTLGYRTMAATSKAMSDYRNALVYYSEYASLRDSLLQNEKAGLQASLNRQIAFEKSEKELELLLIDEEVQDLASKKKRLEQDKKVQELEIQIQTQKINEITLKTEQLEKAKALQALRLTQQELAAQKQEQAISALQKDKEIQDLALKQRALEDQKRKDALAASKRENQLQKEKIAEEEKRKQYTYWVFGLLGLVILLIAIGLVQQQRGRRKLAKQNKEIEKQNKALSVQKQEILVQNEELEQQQEEILSQRDNIEKKNAQLEAQASILTLKNKEVEASYQNISLINQIGREITASLDAGQIEATVYKSINALMPAEVFGIGTYEYHEKRIRFAGVVEKNNLLPTHYDALEDTDKFSVQCLTQSDEIVIKNLKEERPDYFEKGSEEGEMPLSLIYLPLQLQDKILGVITVQSFSPDAYDTQKITILRALAAYTAIALDNAQNYALIESKNRHITDSIRYAQTIQEAVLPTHERMNAALNDYLVLFRPKDIVSGDFYWFAQAAGKTFIAVVDCTGHGVPGAFMSMIGNTILNEIINDKKVYEPAQILEELHEGVKIALKQEHKNKMKKRTNDDGMDVCLCAITYPTTDHTETVKVSFTGAKRPLIYIPKGKAEVAYLRGDNKSIGGTHKNHRQFTQQEIQLTRGAHLYLTSDGYTDQQSPQRRKFGTPQLLDLLSKIAEQPMSEQKSKLEQTLDAHQKNEEQRDDITIVGIHL
ncbi:MAG: tetratricopeptide repeat protein [Bernardetiaceae bacterium]|nr:tetratricopeptide repeat protein [Bernardetiaceae bacterium]